MDKKAALLRWQQEHQIPGKIQSMLTASPDSAGDWCIRNTPHGNQMRLDILGPSDDIDPPEIVEAIFNYLVQEHQFHLRKAMTQLWVRAAAKNQWVLLLHSQIHGAGTGHALNLFENFLERNHPEVIALHRVETRPWYPFRLDLPPKAMRYDLKPIFGPEIVPLDEQGHCFHVLEWLPQLRHPFLALPERILSALSPKRGDKLLDLHCGAGLFSCAMAKSFQNVYCVDARGISKLSTLQNLKNLDLHNVVYDQNTVDEEYLVDFFAKHPEGPWTVILNPQQGEALPVGVINTIAAASVGRIVHICSNLEVATAEIKRWRRAGMMLRKIIPFDLNPSTNRIEIVLFFAPDREGLLRRIATPEQKAVREAKLKEAAEATATSRRSSKAQDKMHDKPRGKGRDKGRDKGHEKGRDKAPNKTSNKTSVKFVQKSKTSPIGRPRKRG